MTKFVLKQYHSVEKTTDKNRIQTNLTFNYDIQSSKASDLGNSVTTVGTFSDVAASLLSRCTSMQVAMALTLSCDNSLGM